MSLSKRREVESQLLREIAEQGIVPLSRKDRLEAIKQHEQARRDYEDSRKEMLRHEIARFYRVAIFGSARLDADDSDFKFVTKLAQGLVEARGVDIVTGGGPGLMEAANKGVHLALDSWKGRKRVRPKSLGVTLTTLPQEPKPNEFLHLELRHGEFSTRLQTFIDKTDAAYFAPGGVGTLLELALLLQTKQVGHIGEDYPLIVHPFWKSTVEGWNNAFYHEREQQRRTPLISPKDLNLVQFSDDIPYIVGSISRSYDRWKTNIRSHVQVLP